MACDILTFPYQGQAAFLSVYNAAKENIQVA